MKTVLILGALASYVGPSAYAVVPPPFKHGGKLLSALAPVQNVHTEKGLVVASGHGDSGYWVPVVVVADVANERPFRKDLIDWRYRVSGSNYLMEAISQNAGLRLKANLGDVYPTTDNIGGEPAEIRYRKFRGGKVVTFYLAANQLRRDVDEQVRPFKISKCLFSDTSGFYSRLRDRAP